MQFTFTNIFVQKFRALQVQTSWTNSDNNTLMSWSIQNFKKLQGFPINKSHRWVWTNLDVDKISSSLISYCLGNQSLPTTRGAIKQKTWLQVHSRFLWYSDRTYMSKVSKKVLISFQSENSKKSNQVAEATSLLQMTDSKQIKVRKAMDGTQWSNNHKDAVI